MPVSGGLKLSPLIDGWIRESADRYQELQGELRAMAVFSTADRGGGSDWRG